MTGAQAASVAWSGACADCCPLEDAAVFRGGGAGALSHPGALPVGLRTPQEDVTRDALRPPARSAATALFAWSARLCPQQSEIRCD